MCVPVEIVALGSDYVSGNEIFFGNERGKRFGKRCGKRYGKRCGKILLEKGRKVPRIVQGFSD